MFLCAFLSSFAVWHGTLCCWKNGRFGTAWTQLPNHHDLALVKVAQMLMFAHFSCFQHILKNCLFSCCRICLTPWQVLLLWDNQCYSLHLLVVLMSSSLFDHNASCGHSSALGDHNCVLCGYSSALRDSKSSLRGNSSVWGNYAWVNDVIVVVHYGVVVLWGRVL